MIDLFAAGERAADTLGVDDPDVIYDILEEAAEAALDALDAPFLSPFLKTFDEDVANTFVAAHSDDWLHDQCLVSAAAALDEQVVYITDACDDDATLPYLCDGGYDQHRTEWPAGDDSPLAQADDLYAACSGTALQAAAGRIIDELEYRGIIDA